MPRGLPDFVLHHVRRLAGSSCAGREADSLLLERFLAGHDESAFAALVDRHASMVWSLCRRVLHDEHEAEDAFQAAFVLLARKASAIRQRQSVGSWLYGVAYRVALRARGKAARRAALTRKASPRPADDPLADVTGRELLQLLDGELHRLPERLRAPLLLCYLEGRSQEEAAQQLGWSKTTLRGRLERGRDLLRRRLSRRGLALSAALFPAALSAPIEAAVPVVLTGRAVALASGKAGLPTSIVDLVEGLTRSMALTRLRTAALVVLLLVLGTGAAALARMALVDKSPPTPVAAAPADKADRAEQRPAVDRFGDPLPPGALARLGTVRMRHGGRVNAVAFLKDGKTAISAGEDGFVRFWDVATGRLLRSYDARTPARDRFLNLTALALSPDGQTLAVGCDQRDSTDTIRIVDVATGMERSRLNGAPSSVHSLAFLPDDRLVSGGADGLIRFWNTTTGKDLRNFDAGHKKLRCVIVTTDGRTLATGGEEGVVRLWDAVTLERRHDLNLGKKRVDWLAFAPNGKTLLATGWGDTLFVYDVDSGRLIRRHDSPANDVSGPVAFSANGKLYACGGALRNLTFWKADSGDEQFCFPAHEDDGLIRSLAFAPDGRSLLSGASDGTVRVYDPATGKERHAGRGHGDCVCAAVFSPDGKTLFTSGSDSTLRAWDATTGRPLWTKDYTYYFKLPPVNGRAHVERNGAAVEGLVCSPDGRRLAAAGGSGVWFVEPETGKTVGHLKRPHPRRMFGKLLAFGPDGRTLAVSMSRGDDKQERFYVALADVVAGKVLHEHTGGKQMLSALAYSPDGKLLASCDYGDSGIVRLYDTATSKVAGQIKSENKYTVALAFSPDGKTLAVGGSPGILPERVGCIELWDPHTRTKQGALEVGKHTVYVVAYSPDGRTFAASRSDDTICLWETATGRPRGRFAGHLAHARTLAFSPDGRSLVSGSWDTTALVWDLTGGRRTAGPLTQEQWQSAWADLKGDDAVKAYKAMWALAGASQTVAEIRTRLKPLPAEQAARIARWAAELDNDQFVVREAATVELKKLGWLAGPALRQALESKGSLEVHNRARQLLDVLPPPPAERLRTLRALEALGHAGDPEAVRLLETLAGGHYADPLTEDARAVRVGGKRRSAGARKR